MNKGETTYDPRLHSGEEVISPDVVEALNNQLRFVKNQFLDLHATIDLLKKQNRFLKKAISEIKDQARIRLNEGEKATVEKLYHALDVIWHKAGSSASAAPVNLQEWAESIAAQDAEGRQMDIAQIKQGMRLTLLKIQALDPARRDELLGRDFIG